MPKQPQSFGEQAARFSLYAPITALVIGVITTGNRDQFGVAISVAIINVLLIIAGFLLGIYALFSIRRYGRKGILGRAVGGLIFNGLIVAVIGAFILPAIATGRLKDKIVGHWQIQTPSPERPAIELIFEKSGAFAFTSMTGSVTTASLQGHWVLTTGRVLGVTIDHVDTGNPSAVGQRIGLGAIHSVDDGQLILKTDKGEEIYLRQ